MNELLLIISSYYLYIIRYFLVVLCFIIFLQLARKMLRRPTSERIMAVLDIDNGAMRLPIIHYETTIGRSRSCDVVIPLPFISRQHAVLTMTDEGYWHIADTKSKSGILVNGQPPTKQTCIQTGDVITLADMRMVFMPPSAINENELLTENRQKDGILDRSARIEKKLFHGSGKKNSVTKAMVCLNIFQILALIQLLISMNSKYHTQLIISFAFLFIVPWVYRGISRLLGLTNISPEIAAFFLTTLGICTTAGSAPSSLYKQLGAITLGIIIFSIMCLIMRNIHVIMCLRKYTGAFSLLILAVNLFFGTSVYGQRNWINLGFMTIQPSEFVKVLFIFTGAATLEWLLTTHNLTILTIYSISCIGFLFLMGDFGTALIFFFTFIVLIFLTSGDIRAIILTLVAAAMGALMIISYKPYIVRRFEVWRHIWQDPDNFGYQQTRTLIAIASGGLLGIGGGNGFLSRIFAADTDLVFGILAEEWGLIIAFIALGIYLLFLFCAIHPHKTIRSSYYLIAACTAAALLLFQASLNVFGSTDIVPITGVTLPFLSNGGSSMAASWGILSFISCALNYVSPAKKEKQNSLMPTKQATAPVGQYREGENLS